MGFRFLPERQPQLSACPRSIRQRLPVVVIVAVRAGRTVWIRVGIGGWVCARVIVAVVYSVGDGGFREGFRLTNLAFTVYRIENSTVISVKSRIIFTTVLIILTIVSRCGFRIHQFDSILQLDRVLYSDGDIDFQNEQLTSNNILILSTHSLNTKTVWIVGQNEWVNAVSGFTEIVGVSIFGEIKFFTADGQRNNIDKVKIVIIVYAVIVAADYIDHLAACIDNIGNIFFNISEGISKIFFAGNVIAFTCSAVHSINSLAIG